MIRVFPSKTKWTPTDDFAFVGDPPLPIFMPKEQPVYVSCTFTWDVFEAERLYHSWSRFYSDVRLGGPAFGNPAGEFEPGMFLKKGVTVTSRGCPKDCPWCFVPKREGGIRELEIKDGWDVQDNNLLACSMPHIERVFEMLRRQPKAITFHGGLDAEFLTAAHVDLLKTIRINELWLACDHIGAVESLERAGDLLSDFPRNKKRCYVLIGHQGEPIKQAEKRLRQVWDIGFLPFAQPYVDGSTRKVHRGPDWVALIKAFSRPAATKAVCR